MVDRARFELASADAMRGRVRRVECTLGLRHGVKGVVAVAVRCKIIVRQHWLLRIVSSRGSGGRLCWRATCRGIADWKLIAADECGERRQPLAFPALPS